jgi:hypothetical protein
MDLNYLLGREQYALHLAETSLSTSARMAHRAFAKAYGALIAETGFPHRDSSAHAIRFSSIKRVSVNVSLVPSSTRATERHWKAPAETEHLHVP